MNTLYDLLGALPGDDAEDLRAAFRRAVKGAHPDLRPGDPDAALKFRQIVRANEILCDAEQRAAYDHLLALARLEQRLPLLRSVATRIHGLASGVIVSAGAGIVAVGCYFLVMQMSAASIAPANDAATMMHASASSDPASLGSFPAHQFGLPHGAANDASFFQARGVFVHHNGNPNGAIANLDQTTRLDPGFSTSYMNPGIVSYHPQQFDRAFADVEGPKHIEKESRPKSMPTLAKKSRSDQPESAPSITSLFQRRTAAKNSSPEDSLASNTFQ